MLFESLDNIITQVSFNFTWFSSTVKSHSSCIVQNLVNIFLKTFLGENFLNRVLEISPSNMLSFFRSSKLLSNEFKFMRWENNLGHIQTDSELCFSYIATSQFVKISEELSNSDSMLGTESSDSSQAIFNIIRFELDNVITNWSWNIFWVVLETLIVVSTYSKYILSTVNIIAEVYIVDLIKISHIHISLEQ